MQGRALALVAVPPDSRELTHNWLCHLDGMNVHSFILVVSDSGEATDLAARGHFVYLISPGTPLLTPVTPLQHSSGQGVWSLQYLRLAQAILALGYDVLLCNTDTVWSANPVTAMADKASSLQGWLNTSAFSSSFLLLRSSKLLISTWEHVIQRWGKETLNPDQSLSHALAGILLGSGLNFRSEQLWRPNATESIGADASRLPVVMAPQGVTKAQKIAWLASNGLWVIDDFDLACKAVTCRKPQRSA